MKKYIFAAFVLFLGIGSVTASKNNEVTNIQDAPATTSTADLGAVINVKMETSMGEVILEIYPDKAPETVKNFLYYANAGTYDGTIFHRVMKGFMNQGGGFTTNYERTDMQDPIANEAFNGLKNQRGTIAMARTSDPHSATNQFFINTVDNSFLDHTGKNMRGWGYAVFGKVTSGMEVMDNIANVQTGSGGPFSEDAPQQQIIIEKMTEIKSATSSANEAPLTAE